MDDGFRDFFGVAFFLLVGGAVIPGLISGSFLPLLPILAVVWILYHVCSGLADYTRRAARSRTS